MIIALITPFEKTHAEIICIKSFSFKLWMIWGGWEAAFQEGAWTSLQYPICLQDEADFNPV
jgi:hypothetical protein